MAPSLQGLVNSRFGIGFALAFGRMLPPAIAYRLLPVLADRISQRRNSDMIRSVRANQWVVHGGQVSSEDLDGLVRDTFRHTARCLYDLYHNLHNRAAMKRLIAFGPYVDKFLNPAETRERGLVLVGAHMSNFDFVAQAAGRMGFSALALGLPEIPGGYEWQNEMRRSAGFHVVPTTISTMRLATQRLRAGGIVMTAVDRPLKVSNSKPRFYGRPAALPVHHVLLALKEDVPIVVVAAILQPNGVYDILASNPIEVRRSSDRRTDLIENAEAVLAHVEDFIRIAPHQWSMFYPVWPEVLDELQ
jgi:lauroyl/myristoyl acyltransferase